MTCIDDKTRDVRPKPVILDDLEINLDKYSGAKPYHLG